MMWIASAWAMPAADLCVEPAPVPDPLPDRTHIDPMDPPGPLFPEIGRASCRERV